MMQFKTSYILLLLSILSFSQTKVSGVIVDKKNQPISFANVAFKGGEGVQTDDNGKFVLSSSKNRTTISASFIGYLQKDIVLNQAETTNLIIVLEEEKNQLK